MKTKRIEIIMAQFTCAVIMLHNTAVEAMEHRDFANATNGELQYERE